MPPSRKPWYQAEPRLRTLPTPGPTQHAGASSRFVLRGRTSRGRRPGRGQRPPSQKAAAFPARRCSPWRCRVRPPSVRATAWQAKKQAAAREPPSLTRVSERNDAQSSRQTPGEPKEEPGEDAVDIRRKRSGGRAAMPRAARRPKDADQCGRRQGRARPVIRGVVPADGGVAGGGGGQHNRRSGCGRRSRTLRGSGAAQDQGAFGRGAFEPVLGVRDGIRRL